MRPSFSLLLAGEREIRFFVTVRLREIQGKAQVRAAVARKLERISSRANLASLFGQSTG